MARLVRAGTVTCAPSGRDHYGRLLARCTAAGKDLSCAMVAGGFAVERYRRLHCSF
jgi:endonuclease YncB( thermonuclease family)